MSCPKILSLHFRTFSAVESKIQKSLKRFIFKNYLVDYIRICCSRATLHQNGELLLTNTEQEQNLETSCVKDLVQ